MKNICITACLFMLVLMVQAQDETEIIKFEYQYMMDASMESKDRSGFDNISITSESYNVELNFGHKLGSDKTEIFYNFDYKNLRFNADLSAHNPTEVRDSIPEDYYLMPGFSQIGLASGLSRVLGNNWTAYGVVSLNMTNDFFDNKLKNNITWSGTGYFQKKASPTFSYGGGVYLNRLKSRLIVAPMLSIKWKNQKRGMELLLPEKIRFWHDIKHGTLELGMYTNSHTLKYRQSKELDAVDIFRLQTGIKYSYVWLKIFKVFAGAYMPVNFYALDTKTDQLNYVQNGVTVSVGAALVWPNE